MDKGVIWKFSGVLILTLVLGSGIQETLPAAAQTRAGGSRLGSPVVRESIHNDTTPAAVRNLRPVPMTATSADLDIPLLPLPRDEANSGSTLNPLAPAPVSARTGMNRAPARAALLPEPSVSFEGISQADNSALLGRTATPPDPNGAVNQDFYVQWVNLLFAVWDKSGNLLYGPVPGNTLWQGFGGPCERQNNGDPIVLYDKPAGRWMMSQFALPNYPYGPFYQCIAVSQTSDPTGAFYRYAFLISDTKFNDYGKFGVWPDAYYMAINQFTPTGWAGAGAVAFERDKMLMGQPARLVYVDLGLVDLTFGGMLPSDADGLVQPPPGSPNYFAEWDKAPDCGRFAACLNMFSFTVDWANPLGSTFTGPDPVEVPNFEYRLCSAPRRACVPQPETSQKLETIADRLMYRLQYRNFLGYETLVTNHTINVGQLDVAPHAGIRWYELRQLPRTSGWRVFQQGTYAPDEDHRWMASAALDRHGNLALGYTVSSETTYPSIRYTGRRPTDPLGTLPQGETSLMEGSGSQLDLARWGDYSMMAVDPNDDCTFWFTHEYYAASSPRGWQTRIAAIPCRTR